MILDVFCNKITTMKTIRKHLKLGKHRSLLKLEASHRQVTDDYRRVTDDYRRATDESQTTKDETKTSHKQLQTSHRRLHTNRSKSYFECIYLFSLFNTIYCDYRHSLQLQVVGWFPVFNVFLKILNIVNVFKFVRNRITY